MDWVIVILYYIIWIPIKYAGLGIWWLVSYPARKRREKLLAEQEAELKAQKKARTEQLKAQRKARIEKARTQLENYLNQLNTFDQLSHAQQIKLSEKCNFNFNRLEDATKKIFAVFQNWIVSDPENKLKMESIRKWCNRDHAMNLLVTNYCDKLAKSKEKASANTELDMQFCRTTLQMGFTTRHAISAHESILKNYYLRAGITSIDCSDLIVNRPCFFKSPIKGVTQRQYNGELYYDMDNAIELTFYLFADQFETLGNSHVRYLLSYIVNIQIDKKIETLEDQVSEDHFMLLITLRNRLNINFWCDAYTAVFLLTLLPLMAKGCIEFK